MMYEGSKMGFMSNFFSYFHKIKSTISFLFITILNNLVKIF